MNWGSRKEKRFLGLHTQQKKKKGFQGCGVDLDTLSPAVVEMVKSNCELRNGVCSKHVCVHSVLGPHECSVLEHKPSQWGMYRAVPFLCYLVAVL